LIQKKGGELTLERGALEPHRQRPVVLAEGDPGLIDGDGDLYPRGAAVAAVAGGRLEVDIARGAQHGVGAVPGQDLGVAVAVVVGVVEDVHSEVLEARGAGGEVEADHPDGEDLTVGDVEGVRVVHVVPGAPLAQGQVVEALLVRAVLEEGLPVGPEVRPGREGDVGVLGVDDVVPVLHRRPRILRSLDDEGQQEGQHQKNHLPAFSQAPSPRI